VENITLSNIRIEFAGGVSQLPAGAPAEMEDSYPESTMWGTLPAYGFFVRHASAIKFQNCALVTTREDLRPVFVLDDVSDISLSDLRATTNDNSAAAIVMSGVLECSITQASPVGHSNVFVKLYGTASNGLSITNSDLRNVKTVVDPGGLAADVHLSGNLR
jgi:hypothetical protein